MFLDNILNDAMVNINNHPECDMIIRQGLADHTVNNVRENYDSVRNIYIEDGCYCIDDLHGSESLVFKPSTLRGVNIGELSEISSLLSAWDMVNVLMVRYSSNRINKQELGVIVNSINGFLMTSIAGNSTTSLITNVSKLHACGPQFNFTSRRSLIRPMLIPFLYLNEKTNNIHISMIHTTVSDMIEHSRKLTGNKKIAWDIREKLLPFYQMKTTVTPVYEGLVSIFEMVSRGNWRVSEDLYDITLQSLTSIQNIVSDPTINEVTIVKHEEPLDLIDDGIYYPRWMYDAFINEDESKRMNHIRLINAPMNGKTEKDYLRHYVKWILVYYETYRTIDNLIQVSDCIYDSMSRKDYGDILEKDIFRVLTSVVTATEDSDVQVKTYVKRKRDNNNTVGVSMILNNLISIMIGLKLYGFKMKANKGIDNMPPGLEYIGTYNMVKRTNIFDIGGYVMANPDNTIDIHLIDYKTGGKFHYKNIENTTIPKKLQEFLIDVLNVREFDMYADELWDSEQQEQKPIKTMDDLRALAKSTNDELIEE